MHVNVRIAHPTDFRLCGYARGDTLKRGVDLLVSFVFLCTLFPVVFLVMGVAIRCSSPGPVLFCQKRHGKGGRIFTCIKFRTMQMNDTADCQPTWPDDPRITPLGRFMRRTFIDELPQFINVLRGDMSIIGPRPHMLHDTARFSHEVKNYSLRLTVRPGITGLAQVMGFRGEIRTREDIEQRVRYDLWYIRHRSAALDMWIFCRTFRELFSFRNRDK